MRGTCLAGLADEADTDPFWFSGSGSPRDEEPRPPDEVTGEPIELRNYFFAFGEPGGDVASSERALEIWWTDESTGQIVTHRSAKVRTFWRTRVTCVDGSVYELVEMIPMMVAYCRRHQIAWHADDPLAIDWDAERVPIFDPYATPTEAPEDDERLKRAVLDALRTLMPPRRPDDESAV